MTVEAIADVLAEKNFKPCSSNNGGAHCFTGNILCNGDPVPIEIEISDLDFVRPPAIRVLHRPEALQGFQPHFGINDTLCYINDGSVYLDRYNPVGVVCSCLDKASQVLGEIASKSYIDDTHEEFASYWQGQRLFIDSSPTYQGVLSSAVVTTINDKSFLLISSDISRKIDEFSSLGFSCEAVIKSSGYIFKSEKAPAVTGKNWPPQTLRQVIDWIQSYDEDLYKEIYRHMGKEWIVSAIWPFFIVRTPGGDVGFRFNVNKLIREKLGRTPSVLRKYLLGAGSGVSVERYVGRRIDKGFIHSRNIVDEKNLRDKKILIIGCGTIGGYLSTYLARLGGGLGSKGKLILCDSDTFSPSNIGRHVLGMYALLENKADAVKNEIKRELPHLNVESRPGDARNIKDLFNVDIVVDATGEEVFSMALNEIFTERRIAGKKTPDVLHVWTREEGKYSQALFVDSLKTACYSCLYIRQPSGEVDERYPTSSKVARKSGYKLVGCEGYMPFPVSASVQAAALGVDMLLDWVRGSPSPRFRTKANHVITGDKNKNKDPQPLRKCPACQKS